MEHVTSTKLNLLFGSFDGLHPGHEYLINFALKSGFVVISLATDSTIQKLKNRKPQYKFTQRKKDLLQKFPIIKVIKGDEKQGSWTIIKKLQPDIVMVGYDQEKLRIALQDIQEFYNFEIVQIDSFLPEKYKSSILRNKNS